jgi:gephyrin
LSTFKEVADLAEKMATAPMRLYPAILIVSETAYNDPMTDQTGHILRQTLKSSGGAIWAEPLLEIVPDDASKIRHAVQRWVDDPQIHVNLILTSGGTGFAVNDVTPEVGYVAIPGKPRMLLTSLARP